MNREPRLDRFNDNVLAKYQVYNSIFLTLPYDEIQKTGALLPLFQELCERGFSDNKNPSEIVEHFFERYGEILPNSDNPNDYQPGDIVTWALSGHPWHIGIVVDDLMIVVIVNGAWNHNRVYVDEELKIPTITKLRSTQPCRNFVLAIGTHPN